MGINRRQFSLLLGASLFTPKLLAAQGQPLYASAAKNSAGQYELLVADEPGNIHLRHRLPARAHHVEQHPKQSLLAAVGRRPETFIDLVDYQQKRLVKRINSRPGYHFYGHAIFTPDGRYLITTENQITTGKGQIVIRDSLKDYQVSNQFSSAGIGPHELQLMPDAKTLVVANGGILTHPDRGREKLNLEEMKPSLAYLSLQTGKVLEQVFMPDELHKLSIRHFDVNHQGRIAIALQYQGAKTDHVPLVAFHSRGSDLELVYAPDEINQAMKQYCGSARFDASGEFAAISSPRGNLVTFWNQKTGTFIRSVNSRDGCGLAKTDQAGEFLVTTGRGHCYRLNLHTGSKQKLPLMSLNKLSWDNHLNSFF